MSAGCPSRSARPAAGFLGSRRALAATRAPMLRQRPRTVTTAGLFGLGLPELVVISGVVAVLFGPSKLPELGKSLGKTVKSFQTAAKVRSGESACSTH